MVKSYLRYEEGAIFGLCVSSEANIEHDGSGKLLLVGALEQLIVWNIRQGRQVQTLSPPPPTSGIRPAVTSLVRLPTTSSLVAVGYADGAVRFWDLVNAICDVTMMGHKAAVTCLCHNAFDSTLASGSKDTSIVIWDVVGEVGLFSLRGHQDQVTDLVFVERGKKLVSSSKDKFVRVWDLDTQCCVQTVVGHHGEIWSLCVDMSERHLVTGSTDPELRVYVIGTNEDEGSSEDDEKKKRSTARQVLLEVGVVKRKSSERVVTVRFNQSGTLLGCQVAGKSLEIYRLRDKKEALKKLKRRERRKREKEAAKVAKAGGPNQDKKNTDKVPDTQVVLEMNETTPSTKDQVSDDFELLQIIRTKHKIRSFSFCPVPSNKTVLAKAALSLHNNTLELYDIQEESYSRVSTIEFPGHRSDIRVAKLSNDSNLLMTASHNAVKIWNPHTGSCLRTIDSGYGLSGVFAPDNSHAVLGTKAGSLEIIDVGAAECSQVIEAHSGAVWSISSMPDGSGFVTGSADHHVKFWEYDLVEGRKQLGVQNTRTLRMSEDVLSVCISPDAKYLAIALLDSTIKVFFVDSLKFFLSLYGHKLPVLCMDISADGALLVSGSADKNMKIWGMDFGDCHKSLFAHGDSVMALQFVAKTHYVFSVGKDFRVKYWDTDTFELLLTLESHHAEVWCLAVSSYGDFLVTGSHDRSIRRWDRTKEPFFVEEEREKRLDALFEALPDDGGNVQSVPGDQLQPIGVTGRQTQQSLSAVDSLIEALEMAENENERFIKYKREKQSNEAVGDLKPNPLLLGLLPSAYVLRAISSVQASDLEQALLMLPFIDALKLMGYLKSWLLEGTQIELVCRVAVLLLHIHHHQLISTASAKATLTSLHAVLKTSAKWFKDTIGFNLAAIAYLQRSLEARGEMFLKDASTNGLNLMGKLPKIKQNDPGHNSKKIKKRRRQ